MSSMSKHNDCLKCVVMSFVATLFVAADAGSQELSTAPFTVIGADNLDSETLLIQRRAMRVKQLPALPAPSQVGISTNNAIDQFIAATWQKAGLEAYQHPPEICDDT